MSAWHRDGSVLDLVLCAECFCDWVQDTALQESHNPILEMKVRAL